MATATKAKKKSAQAAPAQAANGHSVNGLTGTVVDGEVTVKPEPVPGDKGYDWQAEYPDEDVFVYTVPKGVNDNHGDDIGGQTIGLAAIGPKRQPSVGFLRRVRHKQEFDQVVDMIEMVASPAALSLLDEWNPSDLQNLFEQWNEWAQTTAGEASRS
jgi:hypothetical protein